MQPVKKLTLVNAVMCVYLSQSQCWCHSPGCCQSQCSGWGPDHLQHVTPCWPQCLECNWLLHHQCCCQCCYCHSPGCCQCYCQSCSGWGPDHLQHETPCWPQCLEHSWPLHHQCCCQCCDQCWMMSSLSQRQSLCCRGGGGGPLSQPHQQHQLLSSSRYQSAGSQWTQAA